MEDDVHDAVKASVLRNVRTSLAETSQILYAALTELMRAGFTRSEAMAFCLELQRMYMGPKPPRPPQPQEH